VTLLTPRRALIMATVVLATAAAAFTSGFAIGRVTRPASAKAPATGVAPLGAAPAQKVPALGPAPGLPPLHSG
jgi:hypothetical protein